jgi:hypothetical protein
MEKNVEENCSHCCYVLGMCISDIGCIFILLKFNFCVRFVCEITAAVTENGCAAAVGIRISRNNQQDATL